MCTGVPTHSPFTAKRAWCPFWLMAYGEGKGINLGSRSPFLPSPEPLCLFWRLNIYNEVENYLRGWGWQVSRWSAHLACTKLCPVPATTLKWDTVMHTYDTSTRWWRQKTQKSRVILNYMQVWSHLGDMRPCPQHTKSPFWKSCLMLLQVIQLYNFISLSLHCKVGDFQLLNGRVKMKQLLKYLFYPNQKCVWWNTFPVLFIKFGKGC